MEGLGDLIKKKKAAKPNPRLHSEAHVLAEEMSVFFNEKKKFGMYLGVIKRLGVPKARAIFAQITSGDTEANSPRKLFMWLARNPGEEPEKS